MSNVVPLNISADAIRKSPAGPVIYKILAARRAKHQSMLMRVTDYETFNRVRAQLTELETIMKLISREE